MKWWRRRRRSGASAPRQRLPEVACPFKRPPKGAGGEPRYEVYDTRAADGYGWVAFSGVLLLILGTLLMMPAYPFWSLCIFAIDVLAIYGLIAHGHRIAGD